MDFTNIAKVIVAVIMGYAMLFLIMWLFGRRNGKEQKSEKSKS